MMIDKGKISVWTVSKDSAASPDTYLHFLSEDEKLRAAKYRFDKDREMFLLGRGILRVILAKYLKKDPSEIIFDYGPQGKPFLANARAPYFNISHSGKILVMAFCLQHPLGIDVEETKSDFDVFEVAKHHFSARELQTLKDLEEKEKNKGFYRCWTRKESFIKAEGFGLSFPLDAFSVSIHDDYKAELIETKWKKNEKDFWSLFSFIPAEGYLAALCTRQREATIEYHNWP